MGFYFHTKEDVLDEKLKLLEDSKAEAEELIRIINDPSSYHSLRFFWLIVDYLYWIFNSVKFILPDSAV